MATVDAHQHFWDPSRVNYPWLTLAYPELDHDFGYEDLVPHLLANGVDATVLVQSEDDPRDNELMAEIASRHSRIAGIVAWAPLGEPVALEATLDTMRQTGKLVGIRVLIHNRPDPEWLLRAEIQTGLAILERENLPFDLVATLPRHLEIVPILAERYGGLRFVLDHLAKPPIGMDLSSWSNRLSLAGAFPNVVAKVSGLYPARGDRLPWGVAELRPAFDWALEVFGADRLMLGSDWPICEVAGGYERVMQSLYQLTGELSPAEQVALRGGTAIRTYALAMT